MSQRLNDIVAVMDMDGFTVNKKFYCKEMGLLKVGDIAARSFFFDLGIRWRDLSPKDRRSCNYVRSHIHKLLFDVARGMKAFQISALEAIVENFCREVKVDTNSAIAYKGGHYERDLLASLNIPSINLECFQCPKAEGLFDELVWLETCGHHLTNDAYWHCPKVEVEAFGVWLQRQL